MSAIRPQDLSCREVVELITEFLDSALTVEDRTRFEQHVVGCPPCTVYLRQIRQTIVATGQLTETMVPSDVKENLLHAFRNWRRTG